MATKRDYYEILGVDKNVSTEDLKKAYRKMAIKYHPDKNPDDPTAEEKFKEAAEAYDVLNDPQKKARYDQFGHAGMGGAAGGGYGAGGPSMEDIFSQFGDVFGDDSPFGSFFRGAQGGGGGGRQRVRRGSDLRIKLKLNLQEVANGVEKKIKVKRHVTCNTCGGNGSKNGTAVQTCSTCSGTGQTRKVVNTMLGQMVSTSTCPTCNGEGKLVTDRCDACFGEGRVLQEDVIPIKIPAGVAEGIQLSVGGKGNVPPRGGVAGDLLIVIEEEEDADLKRDGNNVVFDLYVNFVDAAIGTNVEVPTIDGKARITLEPGTQSGKILRLKGKGIKELNGYGRGDELVHVNVWTPKMLSAEERGILEKLRNSPNFQPKPNKNEKGFFDKMKDFFHG
ncbi:molecular chaperone DnaJ [Spirosoma radiotolerans]|uniref:Chaperone protein DnaJ n=1 Tax=Spirosoma radiotolerans TaxID=1379870 RepID=A0A0E3V7X3_9BACT|nr:molecular chaperone DnaJ [Spirosoma radiotolerans]AKD55811.1 molecular chaperone DnaJ [Spirosoma radiotolerans]